MRMKFQEFKEIKKQEAKNKMDEQKTNAIVDISPTISTIILHTNGLNIPIKWQRLSNWIFF